MEVASRHGWRRPVQSRRFGLDPPDRQPQDEGGDALPRHLLALAVPTLTGVARTHRQLPQEQFRRPRLEAVKDEPVEPQKELREEEVEPQHEAVQEEHEVLVEQLEVEQEP